MLVRLAIDHKVGFGIFSFLANSFYQSFCENFNGKRQKFSQVNLPKGFGYVEFKNRADAEKAQLYMDGVCVPKKWNSNEYYLDIVLC